MHRARDGALEETPKSPKFTYCTYVIFPFRVYIIWAFFNLNAANWRNPQVPAAGISGMMRATSQNGLFSHGIFFGEFPFSLLIAHGKL